MYILEADPLGDRRARVQAVEILHSGDNRVRGIMWEDLDSQRQSRASLRSLGEEKLEGYGLGSRLCPGRHTAAVVVALWRSWRMTGVRRSSHSFWFVGFKYIFCRVGMTLWIFLGLREMFRTVGG